LSFFSPNGDVGVVGCLSMRTTQRSIHNFSIVCESTPKKKADSAEKRTRQAEKRRVYNKARKSEVKTRMKKVTLLLLLLFFFLCMHSWALLSFFLQVKWVCFHCYVVKCLFPECYEIEAMWRLFILLLNWWVKIDVLSSWIFTYFAS